MYFASQNKGAVQEKPKVSEKWSQPHVHQNIADMYNIGRTAPPPYSPFRGETRFPRADGTTLMENTAVPQQWKPTASFGITYYPPSWEQSHAYYGPTEYQDTPHWNAAKTTLHEKPDEPFIGGRDLSGNTFLMERITKCLEVMSTDMKSSPKDKELPPFDGSYGQWLLFKRRYEETTHRYQIKDNENLIRLDRALRGRAREAVQFLFSSPQHVSTIMRNLEREFGRPEFIIESMIKKVESLKNPEFNKPETILEFGRAVEALVTTIEESGQLDYLHNVHLLNKVVEKLPMLLRDEWLTFRSQMPHQNLSTFKYYIQMRIEKACLLQRPSYGSEETDNKKKKSNRGHVNAVSEEGKKENASKAKPFCIFCEKENHFINTCRKFASLDEKFRKQAVQERKLCFVCLRKGHISKFCRNKKKCEVDGCKMIHHPLLHNNAKKEERPSAREEGAPDPFPASAPDSVHSSFVQGSDGPQSIVMVKVRGPRGTAKAFALLDSGASCTLIKKELADAIGASGPASTFTYYGVGGTAIVESGSQTVNIDIKGRGRKYERLNVAHTVTSLPLRSYSIDINGIKKKYPHLADVPVTNLQNAVPSILIGNNNASLIIAREVREGAPGEPLAWRSKLGWSVSGPLGNRGSSVNYISDEYLDSLIKESFTTENFGVQLSHRKGANLMEKRSYAILENTTKKVGDRWETGLLWKDDDPCLPPSEMTAVNRFRSIEKKMRDSSYKKTYVQKIQEYIEKGYARKLSPAEAERKTARTYYIPHFGVVNPNKPGKFRLVFDARSKCFGRSLNDFLLTGPDLIRPLASVLINFRRHKVAFCADIQDMFHRILIREEDLEAQRFVFRNEEGSQIDHYTMNVMIFGATCSPSSAIFVKNKNAEEFITQYPKAVEVIHNDFYVDDLLTGAPTLEEAIKLREQVCDINKSGGFQLTKFISNSVGLIETVPPKLRAVEYKDFNSKEDIIIERILGLWWDPCADVFTFRVNLHKLPQGILNGDIPTKRKLCSIVMSLFDPLGFVGHFKIKGIMLLQNTWRSKIGWDDEIPHSIYESWQLWLNKLKSVTEVKIPRYYGCAENDEVELHTFVDASEEAFAAVSYLRICRKDDFETRLVWSKTRVAPLKKLTIPRLELQAAVLGCRLATTIIKELRNQPISRKVFWTDSRTVLTWIRGTDKKHPEFIANRVGEIQENTDPTDWYWVFTKENVADKATRFSAEVSFEQDDTWFTGPAFLRSNEWPQQPEVSKLEEESEEHGNTVAYVLQKIGEEDVMVPDPETFSSYNRLLRATGAVLVCAQIWKQKAKGKSLKTYKLASPLQPADLEWAEKRLIKKIQSDEFLAEIKQLRTMDKKINKSPIRRLNPFVDEDGVLRVQGRLKNAEIPYDMKFPIILGKRHRITELLILSEHNNQCHQGIDTVINELKQRFAIPSIRQTVKRVIRQCQVCKLNKCKPIHPQMGWLPSFRVNPTSFPFQYTGIDFFGPLEVTVGRAHQKRWGVIFTCLITRAIHLEIAHSLSTDEAMMALSRFIDTRGRPSCIVSDNGTNFVGAARELRESLTEVDFEIIRNSQKFQAIEWRFNPPRAPHMGGAWERLIKSVKTCLSALLKEKFPKDITLLTLFKSVENIVNSRPLTTVSDNEEDVKAITPNDILRGWTHAGPPLPAVPEDSDDHARQMWKRGQLLAETFWKRWSKEFLPQLLLRQKWNDAQDGIVEGDLVFLVDENQPRNHWERGYVSKVYPGKDGIVRVVEVTTNYSTYKRSVHQICPLGINMHNGVESSSCHHIRSMSARADSQCDPMSTLGLSLHNEGISARTEHEDVAEKEAK